MATIRRGGEVEASIDAPLAREDVCKGHVGIVALEHGQYFTIRRAAKRPQDIAAIVSCDGHREDPKAPEPQSLF